MNLALKGAQLPVTVEPYAVLEVAPDLTITMQGERLSIVGKVLVPKGEITVRELPPSTVTVTDDTVVVGHQTEEGKTTRSEEHTSECQSRMRISYAVY